MKQAGQGATPKQLAAEHPIVRTHPETGRKALYTSVAHTAHIKGWTEKESLPLLSSCGTIRPARSSPVAFNGAWDRWRSGTIAAPCTIRSTTIMASGASCTASPWPATGRNSSQRGGGERVIVPIALRAASARVPGISR